MVENSEVEIGINKQSQRIELPVGVKTWRCDLKRSFGWFILIAFITTSVALNIYLGLEHFHARGLNIQSQTLPLTQSCEVTTFNVSLQSNVGGAILRVIPDCAKNLTDNNTRLMHAGCSAKSRTGACLYCHSYNGGSCRKYSNKDSQSLQSALGSIAISWIRCLFEDIQVIVYSIQKCSLLGLLDFIIYAAKQLRCFPAKTQVITESGTKDISQLKIGDSILSMIDSKPQFTKITAWLHYDHSSSLRQYLRITDDANGSIVASAHHNIAVQNQTYIFARDLLSERLLGSHKEIKKIEIVEEKGIFAPMTAAGNYFILNSNNEKVLAHCFAHVKNPIMYEDVVHTAISVYDTFFEQSYQKMHPLGHWFERALDLVCEK